MKRKRQNWLKIKHAYITGGDDVTFRSLSDNYKISRGTICSRAATEGWVVEREAHRNQVERVAMQKTLQEQIQGMSEGTIEDYTLYEQLIALGLQDVTGRYTDPKDAHRDIKIHAATLATYIKDRRRLREWVHGEEKPVPDVVGKLDVQTEGLSDDERSSLLKSLANIATEQD